jgi:hypothetical protein
MELEFSVGSEGKEHPFSPVLIPLGGTYMTPTTLNAAFLPPEKNKTSDHLSGSCIFPRRSNIFKSSYSLGMI